MSIKTIEDAILEANRIGLSMSKLLDSEIALDNELAVILMNAYNSGLDGRSITSIARQCMGEHSYLQIGMDDPTGSSAESHHQP